MSSRNDGFRAPKGTTDLLPPESWRWQGATRMAMDLFARAGYQPVDTPIFEHTELFLRGVGEATEVVGKQMYTFRDKGERSFTLRPEGTAPVVRAVLENGLAGGALPVKLSYAGSMFRQERPQKGRHRQFFQLGIEAIGSDEPSIDAEVIEVGQRFLGSAGVEAHLALNSIGHPDPGCRGAYLDKLVAFLRDNEADLAPFDRSRIDENPLRTFDSKEDATVKVMASAPKITDHLCEACGRHFEAVRANLDSIGLSYEVTPSLVRGLDYYTRTAFEFTSAGLGSQDAVGGGGRYDGLSEALGGPPLPSIGFALGLDRILLASNKDFAHPGIDVYLVAVTDAARIHALKHATELRARGLGAELDHSGRSMKGQMKDADRSGARYAAILGDREIEQGEVTLKDLQTGEQRTVGSTDLAGALERTGGGRGEPVRRLGAGVPPEE